MCPQSPDFGGQNPYPAVGSRRVGRANAPAVERQFEHTIRDSKTANRAR
uniref:Uncharacterized protein n=1 Tax=Haloferax volcanii (strain ATCC 29605 / DSM 3757 / JCM 8879 / NBRC 14742 / NCIMB 2012 / VKM B-1768 / DS2) TaxID=309800 RepID=D4GTN3_HALVD